MNITNIISRYMNGTSAQLTIFFFKERFEICMFYELYLEMSFLHT